MKASFMNLNVIVEGTPKEIVEFKQLLEKPKEWKPQPWKKGPASTGPFITYWKPPTATTTTTGYIYTPGNSLYGE